MGRILGGESVFVAGPGGEEAVWKLRRGPANAAGPLSLASCRFMCRLGRLLGR